MTTNAFETTMKATMLVKEAFDLGVLKLPNDCLPEATNWLVAGAISALSQNPEQMELLHKEIQKTLQQITTKEYVPTVERDINAVQNISKVPEIVPSVSEDPEPEAPVLQEPVVSIPEPDISVKTVTPKEDPMTMAPVLRKELLKEQRLGETRTMNNGLKATIIAYRKAGDIDVRFEDGTVVTHRRYDNYIAGRVRKISKPITQGKQVSSEAKNRVGETNVMSNGMNATIVAYRKYQDIDVQFADGTIVRNRQYGAFCKGKIGYPKPIKDHVGETKTMLSGLKATITQYVSPRNITVQFDDGSLVKKTKYKLFREGKIVHPTMKGRAVENRKMSNGLHAQIVRFGSKNDIDVRFEDGTLIKGRTYQEFIDKKTPYPGQIHRIGEKRKMSDGQTGTLIAYRGFTDVDVKLQDGTEIKKIPYIDFVQGKVKKIS